MVPDGLLEVAERLAGVPGPPGDVAELVLSQASLVVVFGRGQVQGLLVATQGGVQVVTPQGLLQMTDRFGATFTLKNVAQDLWELFGYLEPGSP